MITASQALDLVASHAAPGPTETLPLQQAGGRILRDPVTADLPAPPYNRVMMDGLALQAASWSAGKNFRLQDSIPAGHLPPKLENPNALIEVMTGGILPPGCDTVAPIEWCRKQDDGWILDPPDEDGIRAGRFIHAKGSDGEAGREVIPVGQRLGPGELAIAATEGACTLTVNPIPRITLITTGDEVVPPEQKPGPGQIRGSHAPALAELFKWQGEVQWTHQHVADNESDLAGAITHALAASDILLLTGGVSMGRRDLVPDLLQHAGVDRVFHRVAQKPGKPLWFGRNTSTLVFGLPGNPVSALVCARIYVVPALDQWRGATPLPALGGQVEELPERLRDLTHFIPLKLKPDGTWRAVPPATSGSLHTLCGTQAVAECAPDIDQPVRIHLWSPHL